jgi:ribosomal protein L12E/L44/L45/RPP1/RPP2|mmetsp:Transcript_77412/g.113416  ORF Transcript_77412/g.113416 Transcript_77412/m.113416 type:complete len:102 (-) Transcript_77412:189-494(-)
MWEIKNKSEVACSLVSIILEENKLQFSSQSFEKIFTVTNLKIETYWYSWFFTKVLENKETNLCDLKDNKPISTEQSVENNSSVNKEENEESDEDMGFGLFD